MHKIAVFTGTRAEYGLLYWLLKSIQADKELELKILVSGSHLSPQFGETWREIESDGFTINAKVEMLLSSNSSIGVVKSMAVGMMGFADELSRLNPDVLVVLGDRFEALAISQAALIMDIPIAHIHGGELTLGAYDDSIRHAITKMASLHFVSAEIHRKRVLQMGEEPFRVINVGAPGLEHIAKLETLTFVELQEELRIPISKPYILLTYHPTTLESKDEAFANLLKALDECQEHHILFTHPNADNGGSEIIEKIETYCQQHKDRAFSFKSLGSKRYLNALSHADVVVGNSSSAIIEAPSFGVPTVNIGIRQKGRLAASSIINADGSFASINQALTYALSYECQENCKKVINPYGNGNVSEKILFVLKNNSLSTIKNFQDMDVLYE